MSNSLGFYWYPARRGRAGQDSGAGAAPAHTPGAAGQGPFPGLREPPLPARGTLALSNPRQTGGAALELGQLENLTLLGLKIVPGAAEPTAPGVTAKDLEPSIPATTPGKAGLLWPQGRSVDLKGITPQQAVKGPSPPDPYAGKKGLREGGSAEPSTAVAHGAAPCPADPPVPWGHKAPVPRARLSPWR